MINQIDIESKLLDVVQLDKYVKEISEQLKKATFLTINYKEIDQWVASFFTGIENTFEVLLTRAFVVSQFKALNPEKKFQELPDAKQFLKTSRTEEALKYVKQRCAYSIQQATDATKMKTKEIIYRGLNDNLGWRDIAKMLREGIKEDGELQRYWQRVATSETTSALNNGYLATKNIGTYVIGQGYDDACEHCKDLVIGKVYKIGARPEKGYEDLDPTSKEYKDLTKYYDNYIWVGKDNIGRSGAKNRRNEDGSTSVRLPHELYTPTIPVHPNCYAKDVEVYTDKGWKLFKDLDKTEKVMTIHKRTLQMQWQTPSHYIEYHYNGDMIRLHNKNLDITVTPDHNMFVGVRNDKKDRSHYEHKLKEVCNLDSDSGIVISPEYNNRYKDQHKVRTLNINGVIFNEKVFAVFMGYYLSEGSYTSHISSTGRIRTDWAIKISQEKKENPQKIYDDIESTLQKNGVRVYLRKGGIYFNDKRLWEYLSQFGKSFQKFIPDIVKTMSKESINLFLDAYILGDGYVRLRGKLKGQKVDSVDRTVVTSSKRLSDDLVEIVLKAGFSVSQKIVSKKGTITKHRNGSYASNHDVWSTTIKTSKWNTNYKKSIVHYHDKVYCVTVPNETLLVRSNGKVLFSGNCRCTWVGFDPDLLYANKSGNIIPKSKDPEKWKEWHQKNIKNRYA